MKSSVITSIFSFLILVVAIPCHAQVKEKKYEISNEKSSISWVARTETRKFSGTMKVKSGEIAFKNAELNRAVLFVDATSFQCNDCGEAEDAKKITEFVKSAVFLNADVMDFAVFKMYKSNTIEDSKDGNYRIEGALTIKGYSNNISLPVMILEKKGKIYVEGSISLNRALWRLENPKDRDPNNMIGQTIELFIHLEGENKKN